MAITPKDLGEENGGNCTSLLDAERLHHHDRLEREQIHPEVLQEAIKGIADLNANKTLSLAQLRSRHGR